MRRTKPVNVSLDPAQPVMTTMGRIVHELPTPENHDPLAVEVLVASLLAARCPEHPDAMHYDATRQAYVGWTHYRAHWVRGSRLLKVGDRPAVMFLCPRGHVYQQVLVFAKAGG